LTPDVFVKIEETVDRQWVKVSNLKRRERLRWLMHGIAEFVESPWVAN
jgi:hypothetical protein